MEFFNPTAFTLVATLGCAIATVLGIPAWSLLLLTLAAGKRVLSPAAELAVNASLRVAILVPAHNESIHIIRTLQSLNAQLGPNDRLLVVADNCQDNTASVARFCGAEVIERQHDSLRGKGYALAFGVEALRAAAPDVVVVVDADCEVSAGGIQAIAQRCFQTQCPVQMLNLMVAPAHADRRTRMLEFAWRMKNQVRATGSFRLGRACHLMGTGMALPWDLMSTAQLATGHVAEDMKLGLDMAMAGRPTQFLDEVHISSEFPRNADTARQQKTRWEHGHMQALVEELPRLLLALVRRPSAAKLVLALDLVIPPLALYFICLALTLPLWLIGCLFSPALAAAAIVSLTSACALALAITISWQRQARHLLSVRELLNMPLYVAWKLPVYIAYFLNQRSCWTRTARKV